MCQASSNKGTQASDSVGTSKSGKQDAESLFDWILSRTGLGEVELSRMITRAQLREKAGRLMRGISAGEARKSSQLCHCWTTGLHNPLSSRSWG